MSRTIRFRVWDQRIKRYWHQLGGATRHGIVVTSDGTLSLVCNLTTPYELKSINYFEGTYLVTEQDTGLVDKTGASIYEGDIVQRIWRFARDETIYMHGDAPPDHWTYERDIIGVVEYDPFECLYRIVSYNERGWSTRTGFSHAKWSDARGYLYEVIGNVHENPELLKS